MRKLLLSLALFFGLSAPVLAVISQTYMGDANLTGTSNDVRVVTTVTFTAARTYTLPAAGATCIGQTCAGNALLVFDVANAISGSKTLTITPASGDTINGSASSLVLAGAGDRVELFPVTGTNWFAQVFPGALQTEIGLGATFNNWRNVLDNGGMQVQQRGTSTVTCAANAGITAAGYGTDRWGCQANVGSGAGQSTASVTTPPAGYSGTMKLWRNSGALTQPVCAMQEIPTTRSTTLAGQTVVLSFTMKALAGLSADNGSVITANIFTGTGADEGLGTPTASPAITPAWTGIATLQATSQTITTTFTRFTMPPVAVPSTVTEIAVALCFTPTASGAGVTDGFEFTGVQLEKGSIATPFEFRNFATEELEAMRYFYKLTETAAITPVAECSAIDTSHADCLINFPVRMRKIPTMVYTTGFAHPTTTAQGTLGACTTLAASATVASAAANVQGVLAKCTATTIPAAGTSSFLYSNAGSGVIQASADF